MSNDISFAPVMKSFPSVLSEDKDIRALAEAVATELLELWNKRECVALYSRIDALEAPVLDILAVDFNVFWYYFDGDVHTKRGQIKALFETYKHLGTPKACEDALSGICKSARIIDWYKYGGDPGHFRIEFETNINIEPAMVIDKLRRVQRVSAILDEIVISNTFGMGTYAAIAAVDCGATYSAMDLDVDLPTILTLDDQILTLGQSVLTYDEPEPPPVVGEAVVGETTLSE